jgi:hypothetical protein
VKDIADNGGLLALDFSETDEGAKGLGTDSVYTFDNVFTITNQGTQPVYVWGTFDGGSGDFTAGGDDTDIWLYPDGDSETKLRDNGDGVKRLGVGDTVHVGVYVDTHDVTSDQTLAMTMTIHADAEKPAGAPGTSKPYPPIRVSAAGTETRFFHSLPRAAEYASGRNGIIIGIEDGNYPRAEAVMRVTDPMNPRQWIEYSLNPAKRVRFEGARSDGYSLTVAPDAPPARFDVTDDPVRVTVQDPGSQEDESTSDSGLFLGVSSLFDATVDSDGLTFTGDGDTITYPGDGPFVFERADDQNQQLVLVPSEDGGIKRVRFTTGDTAVSFRRPEAIRSGVSTLFGTKQYVSLQVPDTVSIEGRDGQPVIEHEIQLITETSQQQMQLRNLEFGRVRNETYYSVSVTSSDAGTVTDLRLSNVTFGPAGGDVDGLRIEPAVSHVNGLSVDNCRFTQRNSGISTENDFDQPEEPATIERLSITGSRFEKSEFGLYISDVTEGCIKDTEFVDNRSGANLGNPTGLGMRDVLFADHTVVGILYSGDLAEVSEPPELSAQIESDVSEPGNDNRDVGVTGIVDSTFNDNAANVVAFGSVSDLLPVEQCEFSPRYEDDDVYDYT